MKRILITHVDLDGVTCAVLFWAVWPEGSVYFENYDTVNNRLRQIIRDCPDAELYITDISPENDPELIDQLRRLNLLLFDHHKTALPLKEYPWATVDTTRCGAMLFWFWLYAYHGRYIAARAASYERLVWHANDYDTWKHESPRSKDINKLLYIYGRDRFIRRFLENPETEPLQLEELLMLQLEQEKEDRYIQNIIDSGISPRWDAEGRPYALVFAEQYSSQVGHQILERFPTAIDYVVIVNFLHGTVGLRSRKDGVDVSEIAKRYGGGGHPGAAGFPLPEGCPDIGWFR